MTRPTDMPFLVVDLWDVEGHGRALLNRDATPSALMEAALNDYESKGLSLLHVIPGEPMQASGYPPERKHQPRFIFHTDSDTQRQDGSGHTIY